MIQRQQNSIYDIVFHFMKYLLYFHYTFCFRLYKQTNFIHWRIILERISHNSLIWSLLAWPGNCSSPWSWWVFQSSISALKSEDTQHQPSGKLFTSQNTLLLEISHWLDHATDHWSDTSQHHCTPERTDKNKKKYNYFLSPELWPRG